MTERNRDVYLVAALLAVVVLAWLYYNNPELVTKTRAFLGDTFNDSRTTTAVLSAVFALGTLVVATYQAKASRISAEAAMLTAKSSEQVLLGGPGESPGATVGLSAGEAPSGRADDFGWPRGVVNVEPAAAEAAAPDTAAADAGAKSGKPAQRKSAMDAYAAQTGQEQKPRGRKSRR